MKRFFPNNEWILLLALLAEIALFSVIAPNFEQYVLVTNIAGCPEVGRQAGSTAR